MDECKESFGPACRDYFWILGRLAENLLNNDIHKSDEDALIDFESLARQLARGIMSRKLYEQRNGDLTPGNFLPFLERNAPFLPYLLQIIIMELFSQIQISLQN